MIIYVDVCGEIPAMISKRDADITLISDSILKSQS